MNALPFEERLFTFVVTELAGLLDVIAQEKRELEEAILDLEREEVTRSYGAWA